MSDEPDSLVLRYLRRLDEKVDRLIEDVRDLNGRLEITLHRVSDLVIRLDRLDTRMQYFERRLDAVLHAIP